ncbi:flagellar biosynthesis anti-sigma factor FlgM [Sinimarinibacterium flocculans]|uniref:flagellar biosynthesis anti-sigma factor FlgM n=1 Tax=Sinimarinibacterium flocculans TaxID=985250 RepID=UPI0024932442|nr:flagellar biosynthesis anti-sigma factor FlgM [Sinimarinibacterium flocculans]
MSNKIESYGPQAPAALRPRAPAQAAGSATSGPVGAVVPPDSVKLTDDAVMLAELREQLASAPAMDSRRVAETRLALAEGRYDADAQRIADKLLRFEWELSRP